MYSFAWALKMGPTTDMALNPLSTYMFELRNNYGTIDFFSFPTHSFSKAKWPSTVLILISSMLFIVESHYK
jgi:hypothetical protein